MNKEIGEEIIKIIQAGSEIPEEYKEILFPTVNKEYEISYSGKMRKEKA